MGDDPRARRSAASSPAPPLASSCGCCSCCPAAARPLVRLPGPPVLMQREAARQDRQTDTPQGTTRPVSQPAKTQLLLTTQPMHAGPCLLSPRPYLCVARLAACLHVSSTSCSAAGSLLSCSMRTSTTWQPPPLSSSSRSSRRSRRDRRRAAAAPGHDARGSRASESSRAGGWLEGKKRRKGESPGWGAGVGGRKAASLYLARKKREASQPAGRQDSA